ncbi:MAG: DUF11 domain-containing protein [Methanosarcinales archaeon]|nr:MAG: DUF11 domain-containing protein [Methanosarcinales archaeon]
MTNVNVSDDLTGQSTTCALVIPGDTCVLTVTYVVQPSDLGTTIQNTGTGNSDQTDPVTDDEDVPVPSPALAIEKTGVLDLGPDGIANPGDVITYSYYVTANGTANLTNVAVTDPLPGLSPITCLIDNMIPFLAAGATETCTATYQITQADIDAGHRDNIATADSDQTGPETDNENVPIPQDPSIDVEKYVSIDDGTTWEDADAPTGPYLLSGTDPQFRFVVNNTGNVNLTGISLTDSDFTLSGCTVTDPLTPGTSFVCYVTDASWAAGQHTDTASVTADFGGQTYSDTDDANYYGADPAFTVTKLCDSTEPVPQLATEANFEVEFENTGNVELSITADDGIGTFSLTVGAMKNFTVTIDGPFSGQPAVNNTVNASSTYTDSAANTTTIEETDDGSCRVGGLVNVKKLTQSEVNSTVDWTFTLYEGPDGHGGDVLASSSTSGDTDGILVFENYNLDPAVTYTVCEEGIPAGWTSFWQIDTDGDGVADTTVIPYNPNADDDPSADIGNRCFDLGSGTTVPIPAGGMVFFQVDNTYPGGEPRTPGYWKNWNYCTGGGQAGTADKNGGWQEGYWLLEDVLDQDIGGGIVWDDINLSDTLVFSITTCDQAVNILDMRDNVTGNKRASDAAYTLAMHLLAAQMNFAAGAETCQDAQDTALEAEELLDKHDFIGEGSYLSSQDTDYAYALELAETLDQYNNGELCTP